MSKLDQLKALGDAKRVSRTKGSPELEAAFKVLLPTIPVQVAELATKPPAQSPMPTARKGAGRTVGSNPATGANSKSGCVEPIAVSANSRECPVCKARRQARAAAQKKWRQANAAKGE